MVVGSVTPGKSRRRKEGSSISFRNWRSASMSKSSSGKPRRSTIDERSRSGNISPRRRDGICRAPNMSTVRSTFMFRSWSNLYNASNPPSNPPGSLSRRSAREISGSTMRLNSFSRSILPRRFSGIRRLGGEIKAWAAYFRLGLRCPVFKSVLPVLDATLDQPGTAMQTRLQPWPKRATCLLRVERCVCVVLCYFECAACFRLGLRCPVSAWHLW